MSLDVNISEPEEFNCVELHSCIEIVAKLKGIEDFSYHVDYISGKGENYIANIFRVSIKNSDDEDKVISVIVKTLVNTTRQELFHQLHKREVTVYKDIIPVFKKYLDENNEDRLLLPECVHFSVEKGNETIILEDLKVDGFEMDDTLVRHNFLDYNQVRLILTELAKFHALSFVLEKQDPEKFEKIKSEFEDIIFQDSFLNKTRLRNYFFDSFNLSLNLVKHQEAKEKLRKVESKLLHVLKKYVKTSSYNVLCHGDFWLNNILFKNEENATRICLLDFQALRYTSPATDITYFLYLCTDSNFRSEHYEKLKDAYYDSLKSFLNIHNIDVNIVYPREGFEKDMVEMKAFGLLSAMIELRIITTLPEDEVSLKTVNIDDNEESGAMMLFKIRVNDVVKESVENGVLDTLVDEVIHN